MNFGTFQRHLGIAFHLNLVGPVKGPTDILANQGPGQSADGHPEKPPVTMPYLRADECSGAGPEQGAARLFWPKLGRASRDNQGQSRQQD